MPHRKAEGLVTALEGEATPPHATEGRHVSPGEEAVWSGFDRDGGCVVLGPTLVRMSDVGRATRIASICDLNAEPLALARGTHELWPTVVSVDPELNALLAAGCALVALWYHVSVVTERLG